MTDARTISIRSIGPIGHLDVTMAPGVTILRGRNGAGKSNAIRAITRAHGGDAPIAPRDGTERGEVVAPGVRLAIRKIASTKGRAEIELADWSPVSTLIDPQIADPTKAEAARIKALLRLAPIDPTPDAIRTLAGDVSESVCEAAIDAADGAASVLEASERVRLELHRLAREAEDAAAHASGRASALRDGLPDGEIVEPDSTVEACEAIEAALIRDAERTHLLAEQRASVEASIAAVQMEPPDMRPIEAALVAAEIALADARGEIDRLSLELDRARERGAVATREHERAQDARRAALAESDRIAAARAKLAEVATGPTDADVERAQDAARQAGEVTARARAAWDAWTRYSQATAAARYADEQTGLAAQIRVAATTVGERLAALLADSPAEHVSLIDGRLHLRHDGEWIDWGRRASAGQRAEAALRIAMRVNGSRLVAIDPAVWAALDNAAKAEIAYTARAMGAYAITEEPADEDGINVERL